MTTNTKSYSDPLDAAFGEGPEHSHEAKAPVPRETPYLAGLNPEQREGVLATDGPLSILPKLRKSGVHRQPQGCSELL